MAKKRVPKWKDEGQRERYVKFRADPDRVVKKKKYLNKYYKKNRKKQLAYKKKQRKDPAWQARRRVWKKKYFAARRASGLSRRGFPLLNEAEQYMLGVWNGLESAHKPSKKKRVMYAKRGAKALWGKRRERLESVAKKFGMEITLLKRKLKHGK